MASKFFMPAAACEPRSTAIVEELDATRRRLVARFAGTGTNPVAYYTVIIPQDINLSSANTLVLYWLSAGTTGNVEWEAEIEAITPGDATDLDAADSFDTTNAATATAVPGTAGQLTTTTVTLTNADSVAAGDHVRIRITRDSTNDTNNDNAYLSMFEWRDAA